MTDDWYASSNPPQYKGKESVLGKNENFEKYHNENNNINNKPNKTYDNPLTSRRTDGGKTRKIFLR